MDAVEAFKLVLALLAMVLGLHRVALKLKWPPATVLLIGGACWPSYRDYRPSRWTRNWRWSCSYPPMLVTGAFYTPLVRFRRQLPGILSLAVGAVVFTTLCVGVVTPHWLAPQLPSSTP